MPGGSPGKDNRWRVLRVIASLSAAGVAALTITDDKANVLLDVDGNTFDLRWDAGLSIPRHDDGTATVQFGGAGAPVPGIFTVSLAAGGGALVGKVNVTYALEQ